VARVVATEVVVRDAASAERSRISELRQLKLPTLSRDGWAYSSLEILNTQRIFDEVQVL
jgi:hypothetical protein